MRVYTVTPSLSSINLFDCSANQVLSLHVMQQQAGRKQIRHCLLLCCVTGKTLQITSVIHKNRRSHTRQMLAFLSNQATDSADEERQ